MHRNFPDLKSMFAAFASEVAEHPDFKNKSYNDMEDLFLDAHRQATKIYMPEFFNWDRYKQKDNIKTPICVVKGLASVKPVEKNPAPSYDIEFKFGEDSGLARFLAGKKQGPAEMFAEALGSALGSKIEVVQKRVWFVTPNWSFYPTVAEACHGMNQERIFGSMEEAKKFVDENKPKYTEAQMQKAVKDGLIVGGQLQGVLNKYPADGGKVEDVGSFLRKD